MSSSAAPDGVVEYEVLYYKRTNKVHKSRGVAKADGLLRVEPARHKATLLVLPDGARGDNDSDDDENADRKKNSKRRSSAATALASTTDRSLLQRPLAEDDTLVLGAFEVQIVACRGEKGATNPTASMNPIAQKPTSYLKSFQRVPVPLPTGPSALPRSASVMQPRPATAPPPPPPRLPLSLKRPVADIVVPVTEKAAGPPAAPKQPRVARPLLSSRTTMAAPLVRRPPAAVQRQPLGATARAAVTPSPPISSASVASGASAAVVASSRTLLPHIPLPAALARALRPHQVTGVDFLWTALAAGGGGDRRGAILADEMGLGKTLMTVALVAALHRADRARQCVVVCPSSLVGNWAAEFDQWLGRAGSPKRVVVRRGGEDGLAQIKAYVSKMKQTQTSHQVGQVLIISYDLFRLKAAEQFQNMAQAFRLLVVDEGHRLKSTAGSQTLAALESIPCEARLCLTATPIQNNLAEFFVLADFCRPGCLGDLASFRRTYERPIAAASDPHASREQRRIGALQSQELDKITQTFMLRRLQRDVLKSMLPERNEFLLFCRPSSVQRALYREMTHDIHVDSANAEALTKLTALRKLCLHPRLCDGDDAGEPNSLDGSLMDSGKLVVVDALLASIRKHAPNDKVVLVSTFTSALSVVETLILQPRQWNYARLDGATNVPDRQPLVDSFNRSSPDQQFCLLLSSRAGGVGLNLVGANRLIMLDADWNPALDIQAMGRVYRQGQTKPSFLYRLFTSGTIEEVIFQRQSVKDNLANMAVDGKASTLSKGFTKEELADCFSLKEQCDCDTKRKLGDRWPEYTGLDGLDATDAVLLDIAATMEENIGHIHVVRDDEIADRPVEPEGLDQKSVYDSDEENEMEFE